MKTKEQFGVGEWNLYGDFRKDSTPLTAQVSLEDWQKKPAICSAISRTEKAPFLHRRRFRPVITWAQVNFNFENLEGQCELRSYTCACL